MNKKTTLAGIVIAILALVTIIALFAKSSPAVQKSQKLNVVASFYPMAFFAEQIGGEYVSVTNMTPAGAEPHDYEPTPQDVVALESSDVVVLNGGHLEAWGSKVNDIVDAKKTSVVVAGENLTTQKVHEDGTEIIDPHVWLAPALAKQEAAEIESALESKDPVHAAQYQANFAAFGTKLDAIDAEYKASLAHCKSRDIITSHAAFGYLSTAYGLTQVPIAGLSPDTEPSPAQLAGITDFAKKNHVTYIFFESLVSPKLADTIAHEVGAQTLVLNPIEGLTKEDLSAGKTYLTEMTNNLKQLTMALQCQK